jgi:hypothetical protein
VGVVSCDLAFCLFNSLLMSATGFSDLPKSLAFAVLMVFFGSPERLPGRGDGGFVLLLTAEHTAEPSYRLGFKIAPLRGWIGGCKFTQVKGWHGDTAPE